MIARLHATRRVAYVTFALVLQLTLAAIVTSDDEPMAPVDEVARFREELRQVQEADVSDPQRLQRAVRDFLDSEDLQRARALLRQSNDTLALCGGWEIVRASVPAPRTNITGAPSPLKPNIAELHSFLGFTAGRLRVDVPEWWQQGIMSASFNGRVWLIFGGTGVYVPQKYPSEVFPTRKADSIMLTAYVTLSAENGRLTVVDSLARPNDSADLFESSHEDGSQGNCAVPAGITSLLHDGPVRYSIATYICPKYCLIAAPNAQLAESFKLYCNERQTGRNVWTTEVWAGPGTPIGGNTSFGAHVVEITIQNGHVVVFGTDSFNAYLEGFSLRTGDALYRFSTSY